MKRAIRQLTLLTVFGLLALVPAPAALASPLEVLQDCADSDTFEREHSRRDLNRARGQIPADLAEYATCRRLIAAALAAGGGKGGKLGGPGNGAGAGANLTPAERRAAARRRLAERERLASAENGLDPDGSAAGSIAGDGASDDTPLPLILTLIALGCLGAGGGIWYAARRNPAVANALRRVSLPGKRG